MSFAELEHGSRRLAQLLWHRGLRRGDRIALFSPCHSRYLEVTWAALRSGLYLTTVNSHFRVEEARHIVDDCDARVLITAHACAAVADALRSRLPKVEHFLMLDGAIAGYESYEGAVARFPPERLEEEPFGGTMLYSSGSTGRPKGIKRALSGRPVDEASDTQRGWWGDPAQVNDRSVCLIGGALYHSAPIYHAFGTQCFGGTVVIQERFDAEEMLWIIERYRVTHGFFVPTMFIRLLRLPDEARVRYDVSSLRYAVHAGAPCPIDVKRRMIEWWGPVLEEYYGATEENGLTWIGSKEWLAHPGSVGRAVVGTVHILDEQRRELPPRATGIVYFSGTEPFEYHKDPEKTAQAYAPDGKSTVGDIGYVDEAGYLYLVDRKDFMIISGGVNIYPREIEERLILHPGVDDAAVFGIPNEDLGEEVKAVVKPADRAAVGSELEAELIQYCRRHLAHIKCPRSIDFVEEFPREPTGKLFKRSLRDRYWR